MYIYQLSRPELAISAAGEDISRLKYVTNVLLDMQYNDLATQTVEKIKNLLEVQCSDPKASGRSFGILAGIYTKQHNYYAAIECYRRALATDYSRVQWRLELARLLAETQQIPEAIREIKICLRLRPGFKDAEKLLEKLSVNPAGFSKDVTVP
jgi:tetratricopeptide (TPR) repeat protein